MQYFEIDWVKKANIEKINESNIIVSNESNKISLKLNEEKTKVQVIFNNEKTDEFITKVEKGKLNIFEGKNYNFLKLLILSEFGLEHASLNQLKDLIKPSYLTEHVLLKLRDILNHSENEISETEKLMYSILSLEEIRSFVAEFKNMSIPEKKIVAHLSVLSLLSILVTKEYFLKRSNFNEASSYKPWLEKLLEVDGIDNLSIEEIPKKIKNTDDDNTDDFILLLKSEISKLLLNIADYDSIEKIPEYCNIIYYQCRNILSHKKISKGTDIGDFLDLLSIENEISLKDAQSLKYLNDKEAYFIHNIPHSEFLILSVIFTSFLYNISNEILGSNPNGSSGIKSDEENLLIKICNILQKEIYKSKNDIKILAGGFNLKINLSEDQLQIQNRDGYYKKYDEIEMELINEDIYYNSK